MGKQDRRRFTEEFKREAVKLLEQPGQTVAGVARSLDVHRGQVERWKARVEPGEWRQWSRIAHGGG